MTSICLARTPFSFKLSARIVIMSTRTASVTQTPSVPNGPFELSITVSNPRKSPAPSPSYQIEEHEPATTLVPFNSSLAIAAHVATWVSWALYFVTRLPSDRQFATWWFWLIYLCEVAFMLQDFQAALELTLSLFGPRRFYRHAQYSLKGTQAPTVSVLITSEPLFLSDRTPLI